MPLYIPERAVVPKSAFDDPIDYYYRPLIGKIYRDRLEMSIYFSCRCVRKKSG